MLVTLCLCLSVAVAHRRTANPLRDRFSRAGGARPSRVALPLVPAAAVHALVFRSHRVAPNIEWYPDKDGLDDPAWAKITGFLRNSVGNLATAAISRCSVRVHRGGAAVRSRATSAARVARAERPIAWLAVSSRCFYLVVPRVVASTWFVYERLTLWVDDVLRGRERRSLAPALVAWLRPLLGWRSPWHRDGVDAARICANSRRRATRAQSSTRSRKAVALLGLTYSTHAEPAIWRRIWVHQVAYAMVRRRVETAHQFTRYASLPLRFATTAEPPRALGGLEWDAALYDPESEYARYYDTVLDPYARRRAVRRSTSTRL